MFGVASLQDAHRAVIVKVAGARQCRLLQPCWDIAASSAHLQEGVPEERTPAERRAAMTWAQRLKRVFDIDVQTCEACGGAVRIIAAIKDAVAIRSIPEHLKRQGALPKAYHRPQARAPPTPQFALTLP